MSKRRTLRCGVGQRALGGRRSAAGGFTLIELMIAMVLGLVVIAGVVSVFLASQQSYRTNQALGDVQDGSRIAFEMMARDIRDAGLTGCGNGGRVGNVLNAAPGGTGTPAWWADWGNAVHGYGSGTATADPALTVGTAATNQVSGTDSLQLLGAADTGLSVASGLGTRPSAVKVRDSGLSAGLTAAISPANVRPGNASTVAVTCCPTLICPACAPGMFSLRRSGSVFSSVTTGVDGCTYSPTDTLRSLM